MITKKKRKEKRERPKKKREMLRKKKKRLRKIRTKIKTKIRIKIRNLLKNPNEEEIVPLKRDPQRNRNVIPRQIQKVVNVNTKVVVSQRKISIILMSKELNVLKKL
jgi:hypothetical protein